MSDHKERTRFSAELAEEIREMAKDYSIIEHNVIEKRFREESEAYEKYGIAHEVPEETRNKALKIMKEMGLESKGEEDNLTNEPIKIQDIYFFDE